MPALLLAVALFATGCGQSKNESAQNPTKTAGAVHEHEHEHEAAAPTESEPDGVASPAAEAPPEASHQIVVEEPALREAIRSVERDTPSAFGGSSRGSSRNEDSGGSSLLHPEQVPVASKSRTSPSKTIRSLMGPTITVGNKSSGSEAFAPGTSEPSSSPAADENLPAVSLHECELFHNHRDGIANELTILYGTDRDRVDRTPVFAKIWAGFCSSLTGSIAATFAFATTAFFAARKKALILATILSGLFSLFLGYPIVADLSTCRVLCQERKPGYGVGRGDLQLGLCHVSVPPIHKPGAVEGPFLLTLDLIPDPERHFLLNEVEPLSDDPFYAELRKQVDQSEKKDLFVFVHGYNVSFEAAALRTAQMKSDLEFKGAACFYSWPSQGGLLQYTRDEENVRYTITHLRKFLNSLTQQSGAKSIHLIAHSMGNRAVTDVLKELRLELGKDKSKLFNQVILAAPDVDAQVFVNEIAPRIKDTAERVTLYASSNDRALLASKIVHGYPRAGESGKGLVVVDGVETVDVSNIDCSFLGHSYYGDSTSVLTDLALVLRGKKPTLDRSWLTPEQAEGVTFWRFSVKEFATARRIAQQMR